MSDYCDLSLPCPMRDLRARMREQELKRLSQKEQRRRGILPIHSSPPVRSSMTAIASPPAVVGNIPVTYSKTIIGNIPITYSKTVIGNIPVTFSRWRGERVRTEQEILNQLEFPIHHPEVVAETVEV